MPPFPCSPVGRWSPVCGFRAAVSRLLGRLPRSTPLVRDDRLRWPKSIPSSLRAPPQLFENQPSPTNGTRVKFESTRVPLLLSGRWAHRGGDRLRRAVAGSGERMSVWVCLLGQWAVQIVPSSCPVPASSSDFTDSMEPCGRETRPTGRA